MANPINDDIAWLTSADGAGALAAAEALALTPASMIGDIAALRRDYPGRDGVLLSTVKGRRSGRGRLRNAENLLLDEGAAQMATASIVAANRAQRIATLMPGAPVHDVTCSIGAELLELVAADITTIGSDLDPARVAMAAHNCPQAQTFVADALRPSSDAPVIVADPARRDATGRRITSLDDTQPSPIDLLATYADRALAIKCAPGIDYRSLRERTGFAGEVDIVSLDGSVRECCLWAGFGDTVAQRRATVLRSDGTSFTVTDADPDGIDEAGPGRYIIDPDGAVVRAGLVRHYAARHNLWQLDPQIAYLTGDEIPPATRGFEIIESSPVKEKVLRRRLTELDCGSAEILIRGVDVDPDALRKRLKLSGSTPLALVITRIGRSATVFICRAPKRGL